MNDFVLRGHDAWKTTEPPDDTPDPRRELEEARARRWDAFEAEVREFAASERDGFAAVLRAVARAMVESE